MTSSFLKKLRVATPKPDRFLFRGGLDLVTPSNDVPPGYLREGQNVEIDINNGYTTPKGYEVFDGQAAPSDGNYSILNVTITGTFSNGDTVTGDTDGATGVIVTGGVVTSGAQDYLVLTKVTGTFNASEDLSVSSVVEGNTDATQVQDGASSNKLHAQYKNLAADVYRADIAAVPGEGNVLGVWMLSDVVYALRNRISWGTVTLTGGGSGSVDGITVNSVEVMNGAETFDTDLTTTATNVATSINAKTSSPNYTATSVGQVITIRALVENTFTVTSSTTTITSTDANMSGHGTTTEMYKSSATGWTLVQLGFELAFTSGGTTEITEGQTITGATSAATAVTTRVMLESGTWAAGTAAGKFIFAVQTGTFQSENINVGASTNLATIAGDSSANSLLADGRYEFITNNFGGQSGADRIYGVDTVNRGFEFDGTVFCPIKSGMTSDKPTHLVEFKNHLFFSFAGSAQHSGIGTPYAFTVVTGASELALGDNITAFKEQPGGTPQASDQGAASLAIFSRNRIRMLYGASSTDWQLVGYREEVGAYAYSVQEFGMTMMLDDRGVANLETVAAFGNFQHNSLSRLIQPWVNERKIRINASCIARDKSQFRLFFSDKKALFVTTNNRKVIGMVPQLYADEVKCIASLEDATGAEVIYFGSSDGKVYQDEKGTSHDGDEIEVIASLHYYHSGTPRVEKGYKDVSFEASGGGYAEFNFTFELGYASTSIPQPGTTTETTNFSSAKWDSFTWDAFIWDGQTLLPSNLTLEGESENISFIIKSSSDYFSPVVFNGALIHTQPRRQLRAGE